MGIFIDDRPFNIAIIADPKRDALFFHITRSEKAIRISTHDNAIFDNHARADLAAQADHRMRNLRVFDPAALGQQGTIDLAVIYLGTWQEACMGIDRPPFINE